MKYLALLNYLPGRRTSNFKLSPSVGEGWGWGWEWRRVVELRSAIDRRHTHTHTLPHTYRQLVYQIDSLDSAVITDISGHCRIVIELLDIHTIHWHRYWYYGSDRPHMTVVIVCRAFVNKACCSAPLRTEWQVSPTIIWHFNVPFKQLIIKFKPKSKPRFRLGEN